MEPVGFGGGGRGDVVVDVPLESMEDLKSKARELSLWKSDLKRREAVGVRRRRAGFTTLRWRRSAEGAARVFGGGAAPSGRYSSTAAHGSATHGARIGYDGRSSRQILCCRHGGGSGVPAGREQFFFIYGNVSSQAGVLTARLESSFSTGVCPTASVNRRFPQAVSYRR
ncbi:hypothetical protein ACP70R_011942 [Stipagrostis hirtigluma subsp. patula]